VFINEDKTKYKQIKRTGTKDITHLQVYNFALEMLKILIIWVSY